MTRRVLCGWLWMHDPPPYLRDDGQPHEGCVRPVGHPGPHMCWCGERP